MRQTRISVYKDITKKSNKKIVTTIIKLIKMAQIFVRYKEMRDIIKIFYYFIFYYLAVTVIVKLALAQPAALLPLNNTISL